MINEQKQYALSVEKIESIIGWLDILYLLLKERNDFRSDALYADIEELETLLQE